MASGLLTLAPLFALHLRYGWTSLTLLWSGLLLFGCASLPLPPTIPHVPLKERHPVLGEYKDYRGVIHCHSSLSHDSPGRIEDIIAAAQATSLDFVVMTDHLTPEAIAHGLMGWQGETLFVLGAEISKAKGSLLGIGIKRFIEAKGKSTQEVLDALQVQDAVAIIAYPERFTDWEVSGFEGVEVYNVKSDIQDEPKLGLILSLLFFPPRLAAARLIDRPGEKLAMWDKLCRSRPVVGIAGTNAHDNVRFLGRTFGTYQQLFQLVTNHILARNLSEGDLLLALRAGHVYMTFDLFGYVPFFLFSVADNNQQAIMGDVISLSPQLQAEVRLPERADIHVLKDGSVWKRDTAVQLHFPVAEEGVYRVEVYKRGAPWIFSNPIYVVSSSL